MPLKVTLMKKISTSFTKSNLCVHVHLNILASMHSLFALDFSYMKWWNHIYLQSKNSLLKKGLRSTKAEDLDVSGRKEGKVLELNLPLYRIYEAGYFWRSTIEEHELNALKKISISKDGALYFKKNKDGKTTSLNRFSVNKSLNDGLTSLAKLVEKEVESL